jgi:hypothetical protein
MSNFRQVDRTVTVKVEGTPGVDAAPTVSANAIKVETPSLASQWETDDTNEVTGSLDQSASYTGGGSAALSLTAIVKGSGAGGQAPEAGPLYRSAALSETLLAADVSDVLQAGSTTTTAVLALGDVAADDDYIGAVIEFTSGTYSGQKRVITDSVASTDTVTFWPPLAGSPSLGDGYTVHACAIYAPASSALERFTVYQYQHSSAAGADAILRKLLGGASTLSLSFPVRRVGRATFNLSGQLVAPADVTDPGAATYRSDPQPVLVNALAYMGNASGAGYETVQFNDFSLDFGNQVQLADDPGAAYGYDVAAVTSRRISGRINPRLVNVATRAAFADIVAGTTRPIWILYGSGDGGMVSVFVPAARFLSDDDDDNGGFSHAGLPFQATGSDSGAFLTFL